MRRAARLVVLGICALAAVPLAGRPAAAQTLPDTMAFSAPVPRWMGQFTSLSANAALGALTGGIIQELKGGSFKDGFVRGALGGSIVYVGKRVAAERFTGAGFAGRELAAVGSSAVRNAADGVGTFDRLILPVAITKVYWNRQTGSARIKLDAVAAGYTTYGILEDQLHFDAHESFSAGTFVFRTHNKVIEGRHDAEVAAGVQAEGVIFRADVPGWGHTFLKRAVAHERVHVLQDDQLFITLNERADEWLFSKTSLTRTAARYIDLNLSTEALRELARLIPKHSDRPWETEAIYLTR